MTGHDDSNRVDIRFLPALVMSMVLLVAVCVAIMPRSYWELDEFLFGAGVESFEPLRHHPHPPGYPALIGLGKVFSAVTGDPFTGMRGLAIVSTLVGFAAFSAAVSRLSGSSSVGIAAAAFFYFSCAQLVHSTTPMSEPPALMFLFVGLWSWSRIAGGALDGRDAARMGVAFALSVGCRPQYAVAIVPGLLMAAAFSRSWRVAIIAMASFGVTCLTWLVPLISATGGIEGFLDYELGQAAYVVAHDAELSRGWMTTKQIGLRFVAHPWGGRGISNGVLLLAIAGFFVAMKRNMFSLAPIVVISTVHLVFTLATSDPADGVRYALVFQVLVALLAAIALGEIDRRAERWWPSIVGAALLTAVSLVYVWPVIKPRMEVPSPPVRAAAWIRSEVPSEAIVLYDNALRPHAEALLLNRELLPVEDGIRQTWNSPEREVWLFADGRTATEGALLFEWDGMDRPAGEDDAGPRVERSWSNAYRKLTRNHYGVVAVIPFPPSGRFLPGDGVFPIERSPERSEWRWLSADARVTVPPGTGDVRVTLHLPKEAPDEEIAVEIAHAGATLARVTIARRATRDVTISFSRDGGELEIRSTSSYVPKDMGARDPRVLAIQLLALERMEHHARPGETPPADIIGASKE